MTATRRWSRHDATEVWSAIASRVPTGPVIGGEWVAVPGSISVEDPATGQPFTSIGGAGPADMVDAIAAADAAAGAWASAPPRLRANVLRRAYDLMVERADDLAALVVLENGKAFPDAIGEVRYAADFLLWFSELAAHISGEVSRSPAGDKRIMTNRRPVGVSLLITPWNFPAAMATRKLGAALAAGCPVVLKPAVLTPLTALAIGQIFLEAGVPSGVVNVVPTVSAREPVAVALADDRVRKLSFTGSTEVGRLLLESASQRVLNCSMELGGNAPFIVCDDADLDLAVEGALVAKMRNAGEACTAANRFYVHESVAGTFASRLALRMSALHLGRGLDVGVEVGPLVDASTMDKVSTLVDGARACGGTLRTGGHRVGETGYFYAPSVISGLPVDAPIMREEIFGPVAPIATFDSDDEVVAAANDTPYGLAAYVFSRNLGRALSIAERLEAGMVGVNRGVVSDAAAPFGGVKQSGLGREGGVEGLSAYLETQYLAVEW